MTTDPTIQGFSLSPLQQHLWRVQSSSGSAAWNVVAHVRVTTNGSDARVEADALRAAIERVALRTELLRTSIHELAGTHVAVQTIRDTPSFRFEPFDGDPLDAEHALTRDPFDVRGADVLRVALVGTDRIVIAQPSLVADATSIWNLVREIAAELAGGGATAGASEDEEAMQFADIAQWLNDNLDSEDAAPGVELWKRVDWTAAEFAVPLARPRPSADGQGFAIERIVREWSEADEDALAAAARTVGVERASILGAAWQLTLARATGRDSIVTGDHSLGREFEGLGDALGPFGRRLPLATRIDPNQSFADLARAVDAARIEAREWHEAFAHEASLPFGFEWRDRVEPLTAGDFTFQLEQRSVLAEPCELALELDLGAAAPELALLFDAARYGTQDAATILRQFDALLSSACDAPTVPVSELSLLAADEREQILIELAPGDEGAALDAPVHVVIASRAKQTPDAVATWANGRALTYAELDALANRIARRLQGLGVGAGDFVGLYLGRSIEQVAAILGVLKAGGAYLPLPPGYPADRIAFMLEDTAARVVLTRAADQDTLPAFDGTVVTLDDDATLAAEDAGPLDTHAGVEHMDSPAYVIFTSGSTGKPKGVAISHANLAHSTGARLAYYEHAITSYLLVSSFAFDSSVVGIFWTLCQGGKLVLPDDGFEQDIPAIAALVEEHAVSHMLALPSLWGLMLDTSAHAKLASLNTVIVAGESCPPELVRSHANALPGARLFNEYGPTEATVWSTVFDCANENSRATVPIGRPIPGASAFVVDADGELCPIGVAGELWIAGAGVAAGYLGRPELTAERFVSAPFAARAYRTGDLARFLPDGNLEFLGRIDTQVKIRGYRIELEEIESALASHAAIREAAVLAREDTPGDVRLVAYTTRKPGAADVAPADLRAHLDVTLPDYMVPARFVVLDEFPQLPNGKIDRGALPAPDQDRSSATTEYVPPATALEKVLAAIWSDVLKIERVGADDDFFDLGGHSILATQLFARMVDMLQVKVPLRSIFDARTLRGLAELILSDADDRARVERTAELVLSVLEAPDDE